MESRDRHPPIRILVFLHRSFQPIILQQDLFPASFRAPELPQVSEVHNKIVKVSVAPHCYIYIVIIFVNGCEKLWANSQYSNILNLNFLNTLSFILSFLVNHMHTLEILKLPKVSEIPDFGRPPNCLKNKSFGIVGHFNKGVKCCLSTMKQNWELWNFLLKLGRNCELSKALKLHSKIFESTIETNSSNDRCFPLNMFLSKYIALIHKKLSKSEILNVST